MEQWCDQRLGKSLACVSARPFRGTGQSECAIDESPLHRRIQLSNIRISAIKLAAQVVGQVVQ